MRRLALLLVVMLFAGCSREPYRIAPVSGRVTLDGKPLANAAVVFSPLATKDSNDPGPGSGAKTDAAGRFALTIVGKETKGAVVGKHKVRITMIPEVDPNDDRPQRSKQPLPPRYSGKDTTLEFEVLPSGNNNADFNLTSS
ncbi:MAG TPA: hypothetical protein VGZ47_10360 [Gemmataceae bacterium]|jgi:hypothetical protein|nr:hypothetical protein [Gemmataceae bacterium]